MQAVDWLWDFRRKEKVSSENKNGLPIRYHNPMEQSSHGEDNKEDKTNTTMEKMENGHNLKTWG